MWRQKVVGASYRHLIKPLLFRFDPEAVHDRTIALGRRLGASRFARATARWVVGAAPSPLLDQERAGLTFPTPIGLAGGFDKNAELVPWLGVLGFGFAEVGSITAEPCVGNPKPRLWRLPESKSLQVNYGLKNDGVTVIAERLRRALATASNTMRVGTNIAVTNTGAIGSLDEAIEDYAVSFARLADLGDYFTINISCPNRLGYDLFWEPLHCRALLERLQVISTRKPLFLKLSPDMTEAQTAALAELALERKLAGLIVSNLTRSGVPAARQQPGGVSGGLVQTSADRQLCFLARQVPREFTLIGCGGVFSAADAYRKIGLGASLVQVVTGLVYQGPQLAAQIASELPALLVRDGFMDLASAVGHML